jgi:hypothetical protein
MFENAVHDVKALTAQGLIVNGECVAPWPQRRGRNQKVFNFYDQPCHVRDLLHFFRWGYAEIVLAILGSSIDIDAAMKELGL